MRHHILDLTKYTRLDVTMNIDLEFPWCLLSGRCAADTHDDVIKWKHFPRYWPFVRNSPVPGEFPIRRPVTWSFDVFFDLRPIIRLSKQWWGWWFYKPSCSLWRHCNDLKSIWAKGKLKLTSHLRFFLSEISVGTVYDTNARGLTSGRS